MSKQTPAVIKGTHPFVCLGRFNPFDIIFDPNILTIATGMGK
jgi:cobalamin-dependent methionine synthase I